MTAVTIKESGKCTCDDIIIYLWERFTCEHVWVDCEDKTVIINVCTDKLALSFLLVLCTDPGAQQTEKKQRLTIFFVLSP